MRRGETVADDCEFRMIVDGCVRRVRPGMDPRLFCGSVFASRRPLNHILRHVSRFFCDSLRNPLSFAEDFTVQICLR